MLPVGEERAEPGHEEQRLIEHDVVIRFRDLDDGRDASEELVHLVADVGRDEGYAEVAKLTTCGRDVTRFGDVVELSGGLAVVGGHDYLRGGGAGDLYVFERQMREAFLIEDEEWREKVCMQAKEVVEQALAGMVELSDEEVRS